MTPSFSGVIPERWPRSACSCQQVARSIQVALLNQYLLWPTGHAVHASRCVVRLTGTTRHSVCLQHPADDVRFDHIRDNSHHGDRRGRSGRRPACSFRIATARIATESTNHHPQTRQHKTDEDDVMHSPRKDETTH